MFDFIAFDLETTGTDPETGRIVEIGAVRFGDGEPGESFESLINPEIPIPPDATAVNGISNDMVRDQPVMVDVLGPFADYCGDLPLVAYNAKFDFGFLAAASKTCKKPAPTGVVVDAFALAKTLIPGLANHRLDTLVRHLKIPSGVFHRAQEDAFYCGAVFARIVRSLEDGGQPAAIPDLLKLSGKKEMYFPAVKDETQQLGLF